ncbi:MAG: rhodanese-like domain-containing protein [Holophagales bacterium]|nr:rhodanese-like domain-containing protein [Holophagales bacterium]
MNLRRFLAEAGTLVGLSVACALVSNALAGKERRLAIPGDYPNATTVTARPEARPLATFEEPPAPPVPAAVAPTPAEGVPASGTAQAPAARPTPIAAVPATVRDVPPDPGSQSPSAELLGRFPVHGQPFVEITGEAAAWLHARGALFLDARRTKDFAEGHVAGARSFPVWESEVVRERVAELVAQGRDPSLPVVLYCSGGDCEDSHMLAQTLFGAGFENLLVYRDGFPDWVKRGGAARTGGPA